MVRYEWDVERFTLDEDEDIIDHEHSEELRVYDALTIDQRLVLVCDEDDRRSWAYVKDGMLPEYFEDADGKPTRAVPKRFQEELSFHWQFLFPRHRTLYGMTAFVLNCSRLGVLTDAGTWLTPGRAYFIRPEDKVSAVALLEEAGLVFGKDFWDTP